MVTLKWHNEIFEADKAVRLSNSVILYDENNNEIFKIKNIFGPEWNYITLQNGEWSEASEIPTEYDYLQADIDFLQMENDALTIENEQRRADVDYCLMLLDGGTDNGSE